LSAVLAADSDSPRAHRYTGQAKPRSGSRVRSSRWRRSSASNSAHNRTVLAGTQLVIQMGPEKAAAGSFEPEAIDRILTLT
ncbi:MAG TPA: hypothetical protein VHH52_04140, partial [Pseudonocardiaceae bacterium]|nr:hypothetical protein [Pseudonocardiaceae bacterium]